MDNNFLINISKILLSKYKEIFSDLVIVLPSRRSSVFMTQALSNFISKPIWLPQFYSIDDFLFNINNLNRVNSLELFFDFFKVYKKHIQNPHDMERCYKWAGALLEDFNEIDKSYADYTEIFAYLSDIKRIENWYLDIGSSKSEITEYLNFFTKLKDIYHDLNNILVSKNMAYAGLSERLLVDNLDSIKDWLRLNKKEKIIFIGLDTLTISQEKIINYLLHNNLCDIFWDSDTYFIDDSKQESGKFLRKYKTKWPHLFTDIKSDFLNIKKQIDIIGTTKNINQAKLLGSILMDKKYTSNQLKKTAIILPNENLLLSVLESIPEYINDINITMGYKLSHHALLSLFQDLLKLYSNKKPSTDRSDTEKYLKTDLLQLLSNAYFELILDNSDLKNLLVEKIKHTHFHYISVLDIKDILSTENTLLNNLLFRNLDEGFDLVDVFLELIMGLLEIIKEEKGPFRIEQECLFKIEEQLLIFMQFIKNSNDKISLNLFATVFNKIIKSIRLKFSGEPLKGIQIMGLLESRTIDFDEVFILSANESELPPSNMTNSFIPFDVKLKFNLRTDLDMDLIYANHFFNLIKRPKHTHIIYNHDLSSSASGERSRFINQLIYELKPLENTGINIREHVSMDKFVLANDNISLFKTADSYILERLLSLSENGFSPSSINLYNYCKRQFYFEKIINVSERKELSNSFDQSEIGSIIHAVLCNLYAPYLHEPLNISIMKNITKGIGSELDAVLDNYSDFNLNKGKNIIIIEAIRRIVSNFIAHESNLINEGNTIQIEFLEHEIIKQNFKTNVLNTFSNKDKQGIKIKGNIDRIDIFNNHYRIIDYKTGYVQSSELISTGLSEIKRKPKILQLLLYTWLFFKSIKRQDFPIYTGVINLRARNFKFQKLRIGNQSEIDQKLLVDFEDSLEKIFKEMFDPKQNFDHDDRDENCRFCD
tara:strand:- start:5108 stop:7921 length:2814 start_codon:yes stop_codon:yes gene_type:complete